MDIRDNATRFLQSQIDAMDQDEKNFTTAMRRTPVADSQGETAEQALNRLRAKHRPPQPKTDADLAAEALAHFND